MTCTSHLLTLLLAVVLRQAPVIDTIDLVKGSATGKVTGMTAQEVTVQTAAKTDKIPVIEIQSIRFGGEPADLNLARTAAVQGNFENALKALAKVNLAANVRPEIKQEFEFLRALATAQQALAGAGEIREAGNQMRAFVTGNANSFHSLQASEVLGDLYAAAGAFPQALTEYAKLEGAPWPEMKVRGALAKGRALLTQGKGSEALAAYDNALTLADQVTGDRAAKSKNAAILGRAAALAADGKGAEAIAAVEKVIADADPADAQLHAQAYVTLGNCLNKAGRKQDALLAFLHVDVLYFGFPQEHAEALANLALLWTELKNADRALEARQTLVERYKNSRWAK